MRNTSLVHLWDPARSITREQQSLITREQLLAAGWSRSAVRNAIAAGQFEALTLEVLRIGGASSSQGQRVLLATLDLGIPAALSHGSAAALWEAKGFRVEPIEVTTLRDSRVTPSPGVKLHHPRFDIEPHITLLDGVPVLTPIATIWSLATSGNTHPKKIERLIDDFWSRRLITGTTLARSVAIFGKRGRRGTVLIRELAGARPPDFIAPESGLESRFLELLTKRRINGFARQRNLGNETEWLGRVDFVNEQRRIVVQIDGDRFHCALLDKQADERQTKALEQAGWQVLRFDEWTVWQNGPEIVRTVRAAIAKSRTINPNWSAEWSPQRPSDSPVREF